MRTRCLLSALLGLWFVFSPWVIGLEEVPAAVWVAPVFGGIQFISSVWAFYKPIGDSLSNLITLLTGLLFAILPFTIPSLPIGEILFLSVFGLLTVFLSFSNLESK